MSSDQRSSQTQPERLFCHDCHATTNRTDRGLVCEACNSDFVEILEPGQEPEIMMTDNGNDRDDDAFDHHNPWDDDPITDDDDSGTNIDFGRDEHGTRRFEFHSTNGGFRMSYAFGTGNTHLPGQQEQRSDFQARPPAPGPVPMMGAFLQALTSALDGDVPRSGEQAQGGQAQNTGAYQRGPPRPPPEDDFPDLFAAFRPPGGDGPNAPPLNNRDPFSILNQLLTIHRTGTFGDAVYSQEALDRIVSQFMEQETGSRAPGPASAEAISALPKVQVDQTMLGSDGKAECSICMDAVEKGETVTMLPCKHWFHEQCIGAWLSEHDTCPHCRKGIVPQDEQNPQNSAQPSADQGPQAQTGSRSDDPARNMPGAFEAYDLTQGTQDNPIRLSSSPETQYPHHSGSPSVFRQVYQWPQQRPGSSSARPSRDNNRGFSEHQDGLDPPDLD